jgi:hypothetical protein
MAPGFVTSALMRAGLTGPHRCPIVRIRAGGQPADETRTAAHWDAQRDHREFTCMGVLESNEAESVSMGKAAWLTS